MKIKISDVIVEDDRDRTDFSHVKEFSESLRKHGLLQPIVIRNGNVLVAGECRLRAAKLLGWEEIECVMREEVDDWTAAVLELEENIKRKELTPAEECKATLKIHRLYQEKFGPAKDKVKKGNRPVEEVGHGMRDTAHVLGKSLGMVQQEIEAARVMESNPQLERIESKTAIIRAAKAIKDQAVRQVMVDTGTVSEEEEEINDGLEMICGNSVEVLKGYGEGEFDFCVTDPPYMVDKIPIKSKQARKGNMYEDGDGEVERGVIENVMRELYRVLKEGAHCYVFIPIGKSKYPVFV